KVPGRNQAHHAERLPHGVSKVPGKFGRKGFPCQPSTLTSDEFEDVNAPQKLAPRLRDRLALFARQQPRHIFLLFLHQGGAPLRDLAAPRRRSVAPAWQGPLRSLDGPPHLLASASWNAPDEVVEICRIPPLGHLG